MAVSQGSPGGQQAAVSLSAPRARRAALQPVFQPVQLLPDECGGHDGLWLEEPVEVVVTVPPPHRLRRHHPQRPRHPGQVHVGGQRVQQPPVIEEDVQAADAGPGAPAPDLHLVPDAHAHRRGGLALEVPARLGHAPHQRLVPGRQDQDPPRHLLSGSCMAAPRDVRLYAEVKGAARRRFASWPSARASQWLVAEYRRRGGRYGRARGGGLSRWAREAWVNVCDPRMRPCGQGGGLQVCRPSVRVSRRTPRPLASQLSRAARHRLCARKRSDPRRRLSFGRT